MTWANPIADVRKILSDGPTDKLCYRKPVIGGEANGVNTVFKTFEARRLSTFVGASAPLGVYVNGTLAPVTTDDLAIGEFALTTPPADGDSIRATYYHQWFNDDEITEFLVSAAEFVGFQDNYASITPDLRPAAKEYAAGIGYQKLVAKMAVNLAETFQLYDAPDKERFNPVVEYAKISKAKIDLAFKLRDDVYKGRKGQAGAPRFGMVPGTVRDVPPNR